MSFDIAVGRCTGISGAVAEARLDGAMLRKLCPGIVFTVQPDARLRVPLSICSTQRPPREGEELFLDYDKTCGGAAARLDINGKGDYIDVDVRSLATDIPLTPRPEPAKKPGRTYY